MEADLGAERHFGRSGSGRGLVLVLPWRSAFALNAEALFGEGSPTPPTLTLSFSAKGDIVKLDAVGWTACPMPPSPQVRLFQAGLDAGMRRCRQSQI
jgi:hypothetical protein